jgi:hypothetical protein
MFLSLPLALSLLVSTTVVSANVARGLPWAVNDNWATQVATKPKMTWYHRTSSRFTRLHHSFLTLIATDWADGPVSQMGSVEFCPMFWGPSNWDKWNQRKAEMAKKTPTCLLGFNEPDISSQSNLDPGSAASLYMQEIFPWSKKGTRLGSPGIAFDLNWMATFLNDLSGKGGHVDFIVLHWYACSLLVLYHRFTKRVFVFHLKVWLLQGHRFFQVLCAICPFTLRQEHLDLGNRYHQCLKSIPGTGQVFHGERCHMA